MSVSNSGPPLIAFVPPQLCTRSVQLFPKKSRYTGLPNYSIFSNENTHGSLTRFWDRPHSTFANSASFRSATAGVDSQLCRRKCMASMFSISSHSETALRLAQTVIIQWSCSGDAREMSKGSRCTDSKIYTWKWGKQHVHYYLFRPFECLFQFTYSIVGGNFSLRTVWRDRAQACC